MYTRLLAKKGKRTVRRHALRSHNEIREDCKSAKKATHSKGEGGSTAALREEYERRKILVGKNRSKLNLNFICLGFTF